jgi:2-amino-4-hydroxy-6-hydroxymethyldihydropteridine diphosphokinase
MKACLLLGSNIGDREDFLQRANECIAKCCGEIIAVSAIYETEPWGFDADTTFLNQALIIETDLLPGSLLSHCLCIENELGRDRSMDSCGTYRSRNIDIDILFYENVVCQTPELTLPHPRLHLRKFALEPLEEVAPEWVHPV